MTKNEMRHLLHFYLAGPIGTCSLSPIWVMTAAVRSPILSRRKAHFLWCSCHSVGFAGARKSVAPSAQKKVPGKEVIARRDHRLDWLFQLPSPVCLSASVSPHRDFAPGG